MSPTDSHHPSRRLLLATLAGGVGVLAGCLDGDDGATDDGSDESDDGGIPDDVDEGLVLDGIVLNTAFPVRLVDPDTEEVLTDVHYHPSARHWHRMPLPIPEGEWTQLRVVVRNHEGEHVPLGPGGELTVEMEPGADTPRDLVDVEIDGDLVGLYGRRPGIGEFNLNLVRDGERVWEAPGLAVRVE